MNRELAVSIAKSSQPTEVIHDLRSGKLSSTGSGGGPVMIPPSRAIIMNTLTKKPRSLAAAKKRADRVKELPKEFSWQGNELVEESRDQKLCGSCWAVAIAGVFSDAISIATDGEIKTSISATGILSCVGQYQCGGGIPTEAIESIVKNGAVSDSCINYKWCEDNKVCAGDPTAHFDNSGDTTKYLNSRIPTCKGCNIEREVMGAPLEVENEKGLSPCQANDTEVRCTEPGGNAYKYYAKNMFAVFAEPDDEGNVDEQELKNVEYDMKEYLIDNGPMVGTYFLSTSFTGGSGWKETNGIYIDNYVYPGNDPDNDNSDPTNKTPYKTAGGHAVAIVGWGEEDVSAVNPSTGKPYGLVKYWICRNSWGKEWNDDGHWKHAMYPINTFSQFDLGINAGDVDGEKIWLGGAAMFEFDRKEDVSVSAEPAEVKEDENTSSDDSASDVRDEPSQEEIKKEQDEIKKAKIMSWVRNIAIAIFILITVYLLYRGFYK